ncbi:hypothetical protein ACIA6F_40600, partial [Streptomyces sp. NPDC051704]
QQRRDHRPRGIRQLGFPHDRTNDPMIGKTPPSVASIYRALAEHGKRETYPEAVAQAHADFTSPANVGVPGPRSEARALTAR